MYKPLQSKHASYAMLRYRPLCRMPESVLQKALYNSLGISSSRLSVPWIAVTTASSGSLSGEDADSFVVPSSWEEKKRPQAPLLLIDRQIVRMNAALASLSQLVDSALLRAITLQLEPYEDVPVLVATEFTFHDGVGHSSGCFLEQKIQHRAFRHGRVQALEELRADGISFLCCRDLFGVEATRRLFATNLVMRLGEDLRRADSSLADPHSNTAMVLMAHGVAQSAWNVSDGRLRLTCKPADLIDNVFEGIAAVARKVTLKENGDLAQDFGEVAALYRRSFLKPSRTIIQLSRTYAGGNDVTA